MPFPGLTRKPTYVLTLIRPTGTRVHEPKVPAGQVRDVLVQWLLDASSDAVILIDGVDRTNDVRAALGREVVARERCRSDRPDAERCGPGHLDVASAWRFLLTDDNVLHRLPLATALTGDDELLDGAGPGDLEWHRVDDHGLPGLRATRRSSVFKILRVSAEQHVLVHERRAGDWEAIAVGTPSALKARAAEMRPHHVPFDYMRVAEALNRGASRRRSGP